MNSQSTGTLTNTTPVNLNAAGLSCPFTITLNSSAAGRKIELSTNNEVEYFTPSPDLSSTTTMQIVTVNSPVTDIKLTGQANDTWVINASGAT